MKAAARRMASGREQAQIGEALGARLKVRSAVDQAGVGDAEQRQPEEHGVDEGVGRAGGASAGTPTTRSSSPSRRSRSVKEACSNAGESAAQACDASTVRRPRKTSVGVTPEADSTERTDIIRSTTGKSCAWRVSAIESTSVPRARWRGWMGVEPTAAR